MITWPSCSVRRTERESFVCRESISSRRSRLTDVWFGQVSLSICFEVLRLSQDKFALVLSERFWGRRPVYCCLITPVNNYCWQLLYCKTFVTLAGLAQNFTIEDIILWPICPNRRKWTQIFMRYGPNLVEHWLTYLVDHACVRCVPPFPL